MAIHSARQIGLFFAWLASGGAVMAASSQDFGQISTTATASVSLNYSFSGLTAVPSFSLAWNQDFQMGQPSCTVGITTTCAITVSFGPWRPGLRQDGLTVRNQSGSVIAVTFLHGVGLAPLIALYPGIISTLAGNGVWGYQNSSDPTLAAFRNPQSIALNGNETYAYITDSLNHAIRRIDLSSGAVTTVAGNGTAGFSGDGGLATNATLNTPTALTLDAAGNLYFADQGNNVIRKITAPTQVITTVAGGGMAASGADGIGDGGPATSAILFGPQGLAVDTAGGIYVADVFHNLIRYVDGTSGAISVYAGGGSSAGSDGYGDGLAATSVSLDNPAGVALDSSGNLYIADSGNNLIRRVDKTTGLISAVAGNGSYGYSGDGGLALHAGLGSPQGVAVDAGGNLFIADFGNNAIRQVTAASGQIRTLAGRGSTGYYGDGGDPTLAFLTSPTAVAVDRNGNLFIADYANNVVRKVSYASLPLSFPSEPIGAMSAGLATTAVNIGNLALTVGAITVSSNFVQTLSGAFDCSAGLTLLAGASCNAIVAFVPAATGNLSGSLKITSNSLNYAANVQTVNLAGNGSTVPGPGFLLGSTALSFSSQVGVASAAKTVSISNTGGSVLAIDSIWLAGVQSSDFLFSSSCPASLAAGTTCVITVTFLPTVTGARSATLMIGDSASGSPQTISLSGMASGGVLVLSTAALNFYATVDLSIDDKTVQLNNTGSVALNISSIWIAGPNAHEFIFSTTCNSSLAAGSSCTATIVFSPGGPGTRTATLSFVDNAAGTPHTVSLTANAVTIIPSSGLRFIPLIPCRIADTRNANGPFGGPNLLGGYARNFVIPSANCGVPPTAQAYSLNFTAVPLGGLGYLSVWPSGQAQPLVSLLNSDGRVKANAAVVPAGIAGGITVFATNNTHVVIDINGYFIPASNLAALAFYPLTPCRIADTRQTSALVAGVWREFAPLAASCNIPASAQAYSLNFTAIPPHGLGFLSTWPTGQPQPLVSTLNASRPVVTANAAIVPAGTNGDINVYASDATDVVIDINGYFAPATITGALALYNQTPCRILDTRFTTDPAPVNGTLPVAVSSSACSVPAAAQAYVLNATVIPVSGLGFISLWPDGLSQPVVSTLNSNDGATTSNMAIVPTTNGSIDVYASNPTHLILDISAYFAP